MIGNKGNSLTEYESASFWASNTLKVLSIKLVKNELDFSLYGI